ncbi:uncharacterized protein LOC144748319 [Ciona intestinalis]
MIRHSLNVIKQAVAHLNGRQSPVVAFDQPLYAIAKRIQWQWPEKYGVGKFVIMMGGLHIEMAALKAIGNWLEDSGWTSALIEAGIASSGKADSFIHAAHVSRTRHAHQVTACALKVLMVKAYECSNASSLTSETLNFQSWCAKRELESPQFQFWSIALKFELIVLLFVRSIRSRDFELYKYSLSRVLPWFFALNHTHYARWVSVHLNDMLTLEDTDQDVATKFARGSFVVGKTKHKFSSIALDHAHEQNNKCVKGDGGAIGLTEDSSQLLRWMLAGPEVARIVGEFEVSMLTSSEKHGSTLYRHHEQTLSVQQEFEKQVRSLTLVIGEMGNPYLEESEDLLVLDTRDIMSEKVIKTVKSIEKAGDQQYRRFLEERILKKDKLISDPIPKNKFPLFSCPPMKSSTSTKLEINTLKKNCQLFSQLYISCQVREGNLAEFFQHENNSCPPALSKNEEIRSGSKADLVTCLEIIVPSSTEKPNVDAVIIDGAAVINMLKPMNSKTFGEYAKDVYLPFIERQLKDASRVDVVWDVYIANSLKASTRNKRGKGVRRRVQPNSRIPGCWGAFLRLNENKTELFKYLAEETNKIFTCDKQIISTYAQNVLCRLPQETDEICPCSQEEADTRLLLHAYNAAKRGYDKAMIRTVDTDVVVIATGMFHELGLSELWVAFGTGKNLRYLPIHSLCNRLGRQKSKSLLMFHALTGCDQVSFFAGRGKKTAWDTWKHFEDVTPAFKSLSEAPDLADVDQSLPVLERFVVLLYDRVSTCSYVDDCRRELFTKKGRSIESLPPTRAALLEHVRRAAYQAGHCWGQSLVASPELPNPNNWGWQTSAEGFVPFWTNLSEVSSTSRELIKCGCNPEKGCRGRCKCVQSELQCTALCKCNGDCDRL